MKKNMISLGRRYLAALIARIGKNIPDDIYLKIRFYLEMEQKLDLNNPQTFNEKINWLKIYYKNPLLPSLADKSLVKDYVNKIIGSKYIIPTYGVWNSFDDIDFTSLPNQFVLKSTNGGGGNGVIVCDNKLTFDKVKAKMKLEKSMKTDWSIQREWVYNNISPRIIAEKYMSNNDGSELVDYKFLCFNGEPRLLFLASDRYKKGEKLKFDWYDMDLNHLPIQSVGYPNSNKIITMFPQFEEMKMIATKLSSGLPHVRVDLYMIDGNIYFGELTFFHDGGLVQLNPREWDYRIGNWLKLPPKTI